MENLIVKFALVICVATPIYLILRKPWKKNGAREWFLAAFWIYLIALCSLTFDGVVPPWGTILQTAAERVRAGWGINLIPFKTISGFFRINGSEAFNINIVGNIIMFIPYGFGLLLLWKQNRKLSRSIPLLLLLPVFIETVQLFIRRSVDIDDVILNFLGGAIGAILYAVLSAVFPGIKKIGKA